MPRTEEPTWQPLGRLPLIAHLIEGMLENTQAQYHTLREAKEQPYVLDDATLGRVTRLYQLQAEDLALYAEQLARWEEARPTPEEARQIGRLHERLGEVHRWGSEILALVEELGEGTIDRILRMDDVELALEVLSGKRKLPGQ